MNILNVQFSDGRSHQIVFDRLESLPEHMVASGLGSRNCLIVTDKTVAQLYLPRLEGVLRNAGFATTSFEIQPGEASKSLANLEALYDFAFDARVERSTSLIALGGGVVGDLAGLCASTLLRGVPLVHVPTTLVSQIDSSIGGKTGVNHAAGKNLIGSFYQPRLVLSDTQVLQSLAEREWRSGLAEMVKHAMLDGEHHAKTMLDQWEHICARDRQTLSKAVPDSAAFKVKVIAEDEKESGRRVILNLGHTVGHAIERAAGYGALSHGESVAAGLAIALRISDIRYPEVDRGTAWALLRQLGWPSTRHLGFDKILDGLAHDKKIVAGVRRFVLLAGPGRPEISATVSTDDIRAAWSWLNSSE